MLEFHNKRISIDPFATNPVYQISTMEYCPICTRTESHSKIYKSLWGLYRHFTAQHHYENSDFIKIQAQIIKTEVLEE
jgi:hypothetical protein